MLTTLFSDKFFQEGGVSILALWLMPAMPFPGQKEIQELLCSPLTSMDPDPGV